MTGSNQNLVFGALLKQYRVALGLTQEEVAERAEISPRGLMYLEHGQRLPYPDTLRRLMKALNLSDEQRLHLQNAARVSRHSPLSEQMTSQGMPPLPVALSPLFGREQTVANAMTLLRQPSVRLLTLTGPAGVGKTRLGLQIAANMQHEFSHGVLFVPLATVKEPLFVLPTLAQALGLRDTGQEQLLDILTTALGTRQMLIVCDNFEQVVIAAPHLMALLRACPHLKILVTSRAVLRVQGEQEFEVQPLTLPAKTTGKVLDQIEQFPAISLFLYRARAVKPNFKLTPSNVFAIIEICRRLDGLPLAIELAAVRIKLLPPEALLARLTNSLRLLTGGGRDLPERQRTMRSAIAWSYDLLEPQQQRLYQQLAVFEGGWTLEAAEAICLLEDEQKSDVFDILSQLVEESLVHYEEGINGEIRLGMLTTIQEYARECLIASGEAAKIRQRHAGYYLAYAEQLLPDLTGPEQERALISLAREQNNLRSALQWAKENNAVEEGLRLSLALWRFWWVRGDLTEGRQWLKLFLSYKEAETSAFTVLRSKALHAAGWLAHVQGEEEEAISFLNDSLILFREEENIWGAAAVLNNLGDIMRGQGDNEQAQRLHNESIELYQKIHDTRGVAVVLMNLGKIAQHQGDLEGAATYYARSLALQREVNDVRGIAYASTNLGVIAYQQQDYAQALVLHKESLEFYQAIGDKGGCALVFAHLGDVARAQGDRDHAINWYEQSLSLRQELGDKRGIALVRENIDQISWPNRI